ncbi:DUF262 domain-containing protein [Spirosoma horti]
MDSQLQSISKIFVDKLYRIPDYQRGYAWGDKQLKDYWSDIVQLEEDKNHYIGVLTLEQVPKLTYESWEDDLWIIKSKTFIPYFVVDGQQRLTTTVILIQAITEIIGPGNTLNYTTVEDIRKRYIYDSKDNGFSRSYMFGYEKDNPSYEYLKTKIFKEVSSSGYLGEQTIYTLNLIYAKNFFLEKLQNIPLSQIEIIYKKVTQNLLFNIYSISSDIDVFVAFETMNNRGKPLSNLELLKNRLIYLSTKFDIADYEKSRLRKVINDCWKSLYHFLGKNKSNPLDDDLFLKDHFFTYFGKQIKESVPRDQSIRKLINSYRDVYMDFLLDDKFNTKKINLTDLNEKLNIKDINKYVENLQQAIPIWYNLFNPLETDFFSDEEKYWLEKLNRYGLSRYLPILLMLYLQKPTKEEAVEILINLEKTNFLISILGSRIIFTGADSYENLLYISSKRNKVKEIKKLSQDRLSRIASVFATSDRLIDAFRRGFYDWDGIRYFLFEYDLSLQSKSKTHREKINWEEYNNISFDYISIEHIYPQESSDSCWDIINNKYNLKERRAIVDSLGNLLPLSRPKNSSLQNGCFKDKVDNGKGSIGYRYGSYSENEVASYQDWDDVAILERGLKLLEFMVNRWDIPLGDRKMRIKMLGLTFVEDKNKV